MNKQIDQAYRKQRDRLINAHRERIAKITDAYWKHWNKEKIK